MKKKLYILALTFLCLLYSQMSFGQDHNEGGGGDDDWVQAALSEFIGYEVLEYEMDANGYINYFTWYEPELEGRTIQNEQTGSIGLYDYTYWSAGDDSTSADNDCYSCECDPSFCVVKNPDYDSTNEDPCPSGDYNDCYGGSGGSPTGPPPVTAPPSPPPPPIPTWYLDFDGDDHHSAIMSSEVRPDENWKSYSYGQDCDDTRSQYTTDCCTNICESGYKLNLDNCECEAEPVLTNWYLDNDGDGYEAGTQKSEMSPGTGWKEGASMGIDCDDNDPVIRECILPKPVEVTNPAICRCINPPNKPKFNNITNVWNVLDGKKWIDYWDLRNCAESAKAQNKESTLLATPVGGGYQVNTFVDKKRQTESGITTPPIDLQKAIDVITKNLKEGKPVMVGVMYERYLGADTFVGGTAGDNNNVATNHFVTIVGMGIDNGKPYFSYLDNYVDPINKNGTTRSKATIELLGTNVSSNRLYCYIDSVGNYYFADKEATTILGPSHGYTLQYVLTEVRDNQ